LNKIDKTVWNKKNVQLAVVKVMIDFVLHGKSFSGTQTNISSLIKTSNSHKTIGRFMYKVKILCNLSHILRLLYIIYINKTYVIALENVCIYISKCWL